MEEVGTYEEVEKHMRMMEELAGQPKEEREKRKPGEKCKYEEKCDFQLSTGEHPHIGV